MKKSVIAALLLGLVQQASAVQVANIDAVQRAAFGIESVPAAAVESVLSKPYPARVIVPNASLQVISAPLDGVIEALLVAEGEPVRKGQPLLRLRSQQLLALQAGYLESHTRRQLAAESLERDRKLFDEGIIAERRLLSSRAEHRERVTAEARDRQALLLAGMPEDALNALQRNTRLTPLLEVPAPIDGVVLAQLATVGQRVAGAEPLYRVGDLSTLWVEVHVPLEQLGDLQPGDRVQLSQGLEAELITVGRMVHGTDQGVLLRAEVREGTEVLRPGQFVEVRLSKATDVPGVRVPLRALTRVDTADVVFVERGTGFDSVPVRVLAREGEHAVVSGALQPGEAVVINGTVALKAALSAGAE